MSELISEVIFNKNLIILQDLSDIKFETIEILEFDSSGNTSLLSPRQFFKEHYSISDVLRVIERIIRRVEPNIDFVPYRRNDTIQENSFSKNTITFHIDTMKPATVSPDNRIESGPRYRYTIRINHDDSLIYDVDAQLIDNYVQFRFYGKSRTEELEMADMFRHIMQVFGGSIQNLGVPVLRFIQGGLETSESLNNVSKYTPMFLDYLMRTEDIYITHRNLVNIITLETFFDSN